MAKELHAITKAANVPLLINDRVDVALAIGAEGVHIGQDDMDIETARRLLGSDKIIGVTASSVEETVAAAKAGADYLGLGTVFATPTKENTKSIVGPAGIRDMLAALGDAFPNLKTVCIGGVNAGNAQRVLYQSSCPRRSLDGIAVVSAIVGAEDPAAAAQQLRSLVTTQPPFALRGVTEQLSSHTVAKEVPALVRRVAEVTPLCHNMTNLVVQNFAANVALCVGGSPIMSNNGVEAPDLARHGGSLVINMGTVTPEILANYTQALRAYNAVGGAVLLDPVGAGASSARKDAAHTLLAAGYFDVIKGNYNEIATLAGVSSGAQRGVDASAGPVSISDRAALCRDLARRERNVVVMTGATDVLSDGERTLTVRNGHHYLADITGSGCTLGTTIAAFLAVRSDDRLLAALAALLVYEIAAERASRRPDVKGPGTFVPAFLDELYGIRKDSERGDDSWVGDALVENV
ncbi:hydroxyethylthiazole kinase, variant 1 [Verruconis gallopava]|nr:hydroxyethylthiazole kinase, variant 1 [Verruconis gallopava]KIV99392.1 hydroxyethylthiazole kinase, variant 1 [Verruconis gallopava]